VAGAVLKFGGSLAEEPKGFMRLVEALSSLATRHKLLIVPGGGRFADAVRGYDKELHLSPAVAHRLAILAMDQYGLLLSDKIKNSRPVYTLKEATHTADTGALPILLPSRLIGQRAILPPSWEVTSDSISAYIGRVIKAERLILITDVDGVFTADPKTNPDAKLLREVTLEQLSSFRPRTCVDLYLPRVLEDSNLRCHIVNGKHPNRIRSIMEGRPTVSTEILI